MPQAASGPSTNGVITVADLVVRESEARVRDLDLARGLGMADPHAIRRTIKKYRPQLETFGPLVSDVDRKAGPNGGRPGIMHLLNRKQALYVTAKSETEKAAEATVMMVEVFDAYLAGRLAKPVAVAGHSRALPRKPRGAPKPVTALAPAIERDGFAAMRLGGETLLVDLLHLDVGAGTRAVVIGWDDKIGVQDMSHARRNAKFLGDRNFILPDPTARVGTRSVWAVGTVVATQPAASPAKGTRPRAAKPPRPHGALPARAPRADLAVAEVCGTA